ncbi:hypothetical protein JA1_002941 [Spathaspora sp. JA1]|nr:hypothetical protein JA1_002941 [Spathaspora sp. JA1]
MYPFNTYNYPANIDIDSLFNLLHQQQYYQHPPNSRPRVVKKLETEDEFQIQIYKPYGNFNDYEVRVVRGVTPIVKVIITSIQDRFKQEFQFNVNYIDIENINWQWYKSRNILCLNIPKRIHYVHSNLEDILNCLIGNNEPGYDHEEHETHEHHYMDEESDFDEEDACPEEDAETAHRKEVNGFDKALLEQRKAEAEAAATAARKAEEERARKQAEEERRLQEQRQQAERVRREAEERSRQEAERARQQGLQELARKQAQEFVRREAEERSRQEAQHARQQEAQELARQQAQEFATREAKRKADLEYRRHVQQEANRKAEQRRQQAEQAKARSQQQLEYDELRKQQRDFLNQFFGFNLGGTPSSSSSSPQPQFTKPNKTTTSTKPKPKVVPKPEKLRKQSIPVKVIPENKDVDSVASHLEQTKVSDSPLAAAHKHPILEEVDDEESIMFRKRFGH